ncbi:MAG TPA: glycosyltransferase family 9 protein [Terriglobales bacterium]|nr:glycosyltransferase family 9 protein [Terriglobales bacterium]
MTDVLPSLPEGAAVALLRLRSLGDTLLLTPALAALHQWRPDLRLVVLVEPRFAPVLAGNPDLAQVIEVPRHAPGRLAALAALRREQPQLVLGLHGGTAAAWLARGSGAPERACLAGIRHGWAYNRAISVARGLHTVERNARLLEGLGMPASPPLGPLRLFPLEPVRTLIRRRLLAQGVRGNFAFLSTEAREPELRWPLEHFAVLAAWLEREHGLRSVQASAGAGQPVKGAVMLDGTTVEELIALEAEAAFVAGNDGGPIHIAAALGKPVFVAYSTTDIPVWTPWQTPARWLQAHPLSELSPAAAQQACAELLQAGAPIPNH